ncbi:Sucrose transport protein SUC3 [Euphorbia peplus]|nr:Sucrose transport protein SUC3 [Euphorbia peplus]
MGPRLVWAISNFIVFSCMAVTSIISLISVGKYSGVIEHVIGGSAAIRIAALIVFALLGFPLAITYSVPFSVTAELTADSGGGQGLSRFIFGGSFWFLCLLNEADPNPCYLHAAVQDWLQKS